MDELSLTETRLVQANKLLRAQIQDLTADNEDLQLHCEKLQATVDRLVAERAEHRDRALDDLALVRRPDSSPATHAENPIEPAAPAAPTQKAFEDVAEILSDHHVRMSKVEFRVSSDTGSTSPTAAQSSIAQLESSMTDLKRRIAPLEAQSGGTSGSGSESVKQDKKVIRTLEQLRIIMQRVENREKHEREIDMSETRERLYELFQHLSRNENDGQVRRIGPFEGTYDEFLALRDRAVNRLAGLEAYDKAFMEARVAAHKARAK